MTETDDTAADNGNLDGAEYVLGVLGVAERREVERRLAREPELARDIAFWEERLGGLADAIPPVAPPQTAWARIEQAIPLPIAATAAAAPARPRPRLQLQLWQSLPFWRSFAISSSALAAACLAALAYLALTPLQRSSPFVAMLAQTSGGQPGFVATVGAGGRALMIVPAAPLAQDRRSMQLWLIPTGDRPHSLGLIAAAQPIRLNIPADLVKTVGTGAALAVSLEPLGGSPSGQPTGPVIASGKLQRL
jgi:anti-sigma-K factor RskA